MSGLDIIGALLRENTDMIALVPAVNIMGGRFPDGVKLPALLVTETSKVERQPLKRGVVVRTVDRVSVTVRAQSHKEQRLAMKLVRKACAGRTGNIGGGVRVSILTAGTGPELNGPGNSFERTQDFRVSHDATD